MLSAENVIENNYKIGGPQSDRVPDAAVTHNGGPRAIEWDHRCNLLRFASAAILVGEHSPTFYPPKYTYNRVHTLVWSKLKGRKGKSFVQKGFLISTIQICYNYRKSFSFCFQLYSDS
ncbi:hypothetical protein VNO77_43283 [Canavalia gladiata]|uniref:Uncharacterized protein n=1 Tax=Canavalia gladiata TaxID=3824 RepID=A0AAN9JUI3_CANGL